MRIAKRQHHSTAAAWRLVSGQVGQHIVGNLLNQGIVIEAIGPVSRTDVEDHAFATGKAAHDGMAMGDLCYVGRGGIAKEAHHDAF